MEDLSGLIDAERMGGSNRITGTNASEISLTNLTTNWSSSSILNSNNYNQFINPSNRTKYFSPALMLYAGNITTNDLRYFAHGLLSWTNFPNTIPVGIPITNSKGYAQGGGLKVNLNSAPTVATIADAINNNLPKFKARSGAMNSNAYVSNIAANIIDYIDTDSTPTADDLSNPNYLGIENIPWPNEFFDSIVFKNSISSSPQLRIQLKDMVEVWNMGDKPIPSGTSISISNNYDMKLTFTNTALSVGFTTNLASMQDIDNGNTTSWTKYRTFTTTNTIPPNGYAVLQSDKSVNGTLHFSLGASLTNPAWYATAAIRAAWYLYSPSNDATTNMAYKAKLGSGSSGQLIQTTKDGRWTRYLAASSKLTFDPATPNTYIFCNNIGYASQTAINGVPSHTGGDPRAQLFLSGALYNQNYTNKYASPGGRNIGRLQVGTFPESEVNPAKFWPDNGHATNSDLGGDPTTTQSPMTFSNTPATNNWVMKRNDSGTMTNILELGNIYDPMQWGDQSGSGVANQPGLWTNLTSSATNDPRFGGRTTLRIGRPEFKRFAFTNVGGTYPVPNMGMSSAALLDIFSLSNSFDNGGRINLNTAPAPVLRALAGGVTLSNDMALKPSTNLVVPTRMTEAFAQGVMRYRAMYPFLSPSQLAFIATDYGATNSASTHWTNTWPTNAVFGNTNPTISLTNAPGNTLGSSASIGATEWNDQAAEEWFSKIYNLSTAQSWNYRTYVVAQLVNTNGIPTGPTMRKYSLMYVRYSANFPTINGGPLVTFESPY
jgi:hypothetical protein